MSTVKSDSKLMDWIKEKLKSIWLWIFVVVLGGAYVLAAPIGAPTQPDPSFTVQKGVSVESAIRFGFDTLEGYTATIKESITKDFPIKYSEGGGFISFKPTIIRWDTGLSVRSVINRDKSDSTPAKINDRGFSYKGAFGTDIDVEIEIFNDSFNKTTKINSLAVLGVIPVDAQFLELEFEIKTDYSLPQGIVTKKISLTELSSLQPAGVWDSSIDQRSLVVESEIIEIGNKLFLMKRIPVDWLKTATFPILTDSTITFGTESQFDSSVVNDTEIETLTDDTFVVCWTDDTDTTEEGKCRVGTVSGTTPTYGTTVQFVSDSGPVGQIDVCAIGTDRFAVVYPDDGQLDDGFIRVASTTGTTINGFGTAIEFETGDTEYPACTEISTDKVFIGYNDEGASDTAKGVVCDIDGDELPACGTPTDVAVTDFFWEEGHCDTLDTDKFACAYGAGDTNSAFAVAGTVSGTTITFGTPVEFSATNTTFAVDIAVMKDSTTDFVTVIHNQPENQGNAFACTVSGTAVTCGDFLNFTGTDGGQWPSITEVDATNFVIGNSASSVANDPGVAYTCEANFSTRVITCDAKTQFSSSDTEYTSATLLSTCKVAISFQDEGDAANDGKMIVGDVTGPASCAVGEADPTTGTPSWYQSGNSFIKGNVFVK